MNIIANAAILYYTEQNPIKKTSLSGRYNEFLKARELKYFIGHIWTMEHDLHYSIDNRNYNNLP